MSITTIYSFNLLIDMHLCHCFTLLYCCMWFRRMKTNTVYISLIAIIVTLLAYSVSASVERSTSSSSGSRNRPSAALRPRARINGPPRNQEQLPVGLWNYVVYASLLCITCHFVCTVLSMLQIAYH